MQEYNQNYFTAYSVRPVLILNEIDFTIRHEQAGRQPSLIGAGFTINNVRIYRENHLETHRGELPESICNQSQLCLWVHEIQNENYSFNDITQFLTEFSPTERSPHQPDEYDFVAYQVIRKFNLSTQSI